MNDAMSLGVHRIWKNEFVNSLGLLKPNKIFKDGKTFEEKLQVIDMAGGTGDISFRIWERAKSCSEQYYSKKFFILSNIFLFCYQENFSIQNKFNYLFLE